MTTRLLLSVTLLLSACGPAPPPAPKPKPDPTLEVSYTQSVETLAGMAREAESLHRSGKLDEAGAAITRAQALSARVLEVPRPTLAAMEAAADLDDLYGRMLLANRHYAWARMLFQKNLARWKNWTPRTEETARREKRAAEAIAACDKGMTQ